MFFIQETEVCNFADDTAQLYVHAHQILKRQYVANLGKFQIMFLGLNINNSKITFMIENKRVKSRSEVKLLDTTVEDKLSFTTHIENLCNTAGNRLQALARTRKFLSFQLGKRL